MSFFSKFMVKKSIAAIQADSQKGELKRTLSAANLVSLGIGCIIGAGIFVMTGQAAANYAGPAITISFVLAGLCCAFAGLCYAELASMLPVSGSAYSYSYASLGELVAWLMGWLLLLEYGVAASTVAVGWSGYVVSFLGNFGIVIPPEFTTPTLKMDHDLGALVFTGGINLPALFGILMMTVLLVVGVKESANVNNIIVAIKLTVVLLFIGVGAFYVNPENWHPFIPDNTGVDGQYGWSGILRGAGVVFFAYVGFEAVSTAAQEAKNPKRDVPIGILGSLVVCTALYIAVALVLTGIVHYDMLNVADPIARAVDAVGLPWLSFLIKVGAIAGLTSVMMVLMYGQTRIFYTMSRDGLMPAAFSKVHPKFQTPYINTIVVGLVIAVVASATPIDILGDLVSLGTLTAFAIICFTVMYLRKAQPDMPRPFKVPFSPYFPVLGILFCGYLIYGLLSNPVTVRFYIVYVAVGLAVYFLYSHKHSKLRSGEEAMAHIVHSTDGIDPK
ncbi:MAG: amino acid permease [Alphaproteobacteria bacterium]|nr:amino acid permease [Alphaproteobacteria bacterium]